MRVLDRLHRTVVLPALIGVCLPHATARAATTRTVSLAYASARDAEGGVVHKQERVRVRGTATVGPYVFDNRYALFFIENDRAGIAVHSPLLRLPQFGPGTVVDVTGRIDQFNGQPQIVLESMAIAGRSAVPRALHIEPGEVQMPRFLGRLVETSGVVDSFENRSGMLVTLVGAGHEHFRVYFSHEQRRDIPIEWKRGDFVNVAGVLTQYDPEPPYHSGWQIRPRTASDCDIAPKSWIDRKHAVPAVLLLAAVVLAILTWTSLLRRRVARATESLADTVAVLKAQQEASPAGILVLDHDLRVREFNRRFLSMWNVSEEAVWSGSLCDILSRQFADSAVAEDLHRLAADTSDPQISRDVALKDGRILSIVQAPLTIHHSAGWLWTFHDVTEREWMREQLDRSARVASLGRLAASIAHEFNNVLMVIQTQTELLRRRAPEHVSSIEKIIAAVDRGRGTTTDVLNLTRPLELDRHTISVDDLMERIEAEFMSTLRPDLEIVIDAPPVDALVSIDVPQMMQVFINIALNAQQALEGPGRIHVGCAVSKRAMVHSGSLGRESESLHLTFEDNGPGIPNDVLNHVFEPLFSTKKRNGTGLGLAIVHRIVTAHGGDIFVESEPGVSTTFHVKLPLEPLRAGERAAEPTAAAPAALSRGWRVLLVEDDPAVAEAIVETLRTEGIFVEHVVCGEDAVAAAELLQPDIAVLDLDLPGIGGEEVADALTARWNSLPIIFSSGHRDRFRFSADSRHRMTFLPKPYPFSHLLHEIGRLCEARAAA